MNQVWYLRPSISTAPKQTEPEVEPRSASGLSLCGSNYPSVEVVTFPFSPAQKLPRWIPQTATPRVFAKEFGPADSPFGLNSWAPFSCQTCVLTTNYIDLMIRSDTHTTRCDLLLMEPRIIFSIFRVEGRIFKMTGFNIHSSQKYLTPRGNLWKFESGLSQ